jgi:HAD superfamily hydrolase (TIGR01509 family)
MENGVADFTFETFLYYVGMSNEKVAADYIKSDGIEKSITKLVREKQAMYMEFIPDIQLFEGVHQILQRYQKTMQLAVASSSHQLEIKAILEAKELAGYFSRVVGGDMVEKKKPDPEIYLMVQSLFNVAAEECIAFEDSASGLNAAKNAGMYGVAIPNEFTRNHDFKRADRILNTLAEVDDELIRQLLHSA